VSSDPISSSSWSDRFAIAAIAATALFYEVAITRILSVILWYHFAFLAVSLAMLGLGAPGVWFALRKPGPRALERSMLAAAVLVPASIVALFRFGEPLAARTAFATVCVAAPMLALGTAICLLLLRARGAGIGSMYAADLIGATCGTLLVVPLLHVVPTPLLIAGAGALPLVALLLIGRTYCRAALGLLVLLIATIVWREPYRLRYTKTYSESKLPPLYEEWTPTARLAVFPNPFWISRPESGFGWGLGSNYVPRPVQQLWLEQDGGAGTPITHYTGSPSELSHLLWDVTSIGDQLFRPKSVCVIGAGGGRDILGAIAVGANDVTAVELNQHTIRLVSGRFGEFSGDIYHRPGVRAVAGEGRSFLTGTPDRYDMIQISLIDSWAATTAGAYALSENYLYTVEAYRLYWNRLTPHGVVSTSRWIGGMNRLETVRLAHLVREALTLEGIEHPEHHLMIVQGSTVATVLMMKDPITVDGLAAVDSLCAYYGFHRHWPPTETPSRDAKVEELAPILKLGPEAFRERGLEVSPPVDDRPFFFQTASILGRIEPAKVRAISLNEQAARILRMLMAIVTALGLAVFFLPFALNRRIERHPGFWRGGAYFASIGLAFMLVEIPSIQRSILYLGHPCHATTVVLSSILFGAGLGSWLAGRGALDLRAWALALLVVLVAANLVMSPLLHATIGWVWVARAAIAFGVFGALGFLMGFGFPLGIIHFGDENKAWFWAVNGASGVVASVFSLALAMAFGYTRVVYAGIALYAVAGLLLNLSPKPAPRAAG